MHREYQAAKPVPVKIGDVEYFLLYTFGKIKRIREELKVDLLEKAEVDLDVFNKVLLMGLVDPKGLTEEKIDELITLPQLPYYVERLQLALTGQIQPSQSTKNALPASRQQETGSGNEKAETKSNCGSGQPQLVGESRTQPSGA